MPMAARGHMRVDEVAEAEMAGSRPPRKRPAVVAGAEPLWAVERFDGNRAQLVAGKRREVMRAEKNGPHAASDVSRPRASALEQIAP